MSRVVEIKFMIPVKALKYKNTAFFQEFFQNLYRSILCELKGIPVELKEAEGEVMIKGASIKLHLDHAGSLHLNISLGGTSLDYQSAKEIINKIEKIISKLEKTR